MALSIDGLQISLPLLQGMRNELDSLSFHCYVLIKSRETDMSLILNMDSVGDYNSFLGQETLHPLVSVINFSQVPPVRHIRKMYGFYAVFLKDLKCGALRYGRHYYDYQEGTLVFVSPGQVLGNDDTGEYFRIEGYALLFHPDLLRGTSLEHKMKKYSFFSYDASESLHMSEKERHLFLNILKEIHAELERGVDRHTKSIVTANIEVLLNHCLRFYDRQFITRENVNKDVLTEFERLLDSYFEEDRPQELGLPCVQYFADKLHFSANYFGDLVKKETGKTPQEHIQIKLVDKAKEFLCSTNKSVSEIAYVLGFKYPHHLSRMFKKNTGLSPNEFRASA